MKKYLPWLKEADSQALQYACRQLDNAYKKFFKKEAGFPRFKSRKAAEQSYTIGDGKRINFKDRMIKIPPAGWVKVLDNRKLPKNAVICSVTITRDHDQYFASLCFKTPEEPVMIQPDKNKAIGLDYKSNGLYKDSDGNDPDMPKYYRRSEKAIGKEQCKLSRKQGASKGETQSNNFKKQQKRLFKKARHAANQRKDFLHKHSSEIANRYDVVCVESLNMQVMSNKGFGNGKATLDNGYGMFLRMLEYKLKQRGKYFVKVDKFYPSSQICHCCGYRNPELKNLRIREWLCPKCGAIHDRDENAAINIKNEGLRILGITV